MFEYRKNSEEGSSVDWDEIFAVVLKQNFCIISGIKWALTERCWKPQ